jgi:hypothetical protein
MIDYDQYLQTLVLRWIYQHDEWVLPLVAAVVVLTKGRRWAAPVHFVLLALLLVYAAEYRMHWHSWVAVPILVFAIVSDFTRDFWYRFLGGLQRRSGGDATAPAPGRERRKRLHYLLALWVVQVAVIVAAFVYFDAPADVWAIAAGAAVLAALLAILPAWRRWAETRFQRELTRDPRLGRYLDWVRWTRMRTPEHRRSLLAENWIATARTHADPGGVLLWIARCLIRPRRMPTIQSRFIGQNLERERAQEWHKLQVVLHGGASDPKIVLPPVSEILALQTGQTELRNWLAMTEALAECVAFSNERPGEIEKSPDLAVRSGGFQARPYTIPVQDDGGPAAAAHRDAFYQAPAAIRERFGSHRQSSPISFIQRAAGHLCEYMLIPHRVADSGRPRWLLAAEFLAHAGDVEQEIVLDFRREASESNATRAALEEQIAEHTIRAARYFDLASCCIENYLVPGSGVPAAPLVARWDSFIGGTTWWRPRLEQDPKAAEEGLWRMVLALRYQLLDTLLPQPASGVPAARHVVSLFRGDLGSAPPARLLAAALARDAADTSLWIASRQGDPSARWVFDDRRLWPDRLKQADYWRARLRSGALGAGEAVTICESAIARVLHLWGLAIEQDLDFLRPGTDSWRDRLETAADFFIYAGSLRAKRLAAMAERHAQPAEIFEEIVELV